MMPSRNLRGSSSTRIRRQQHADVAPRERKGKVSGERGSISLDAVGIARLGQNRHSPETDGGLRLEAEVGGGAQHALARLSLDSIAVVENPADRAGGNMGEPAEIVDGRLLCRHRCVNRTTCGGVCRYGQPGSGSPCACRFFHGGLIFISAQSPLPITGDPPALAFPGWGRCFGWSVTVSSPSFKPLSCMMETEEEARFQTFVPQAIVEAFNRTIPQPPHTIGVEHDPRIAENPWEIAACGRLAHPVDSAATRLGAAQSSRPGRPPCRTFLAYAPRPALGNLMQWQRTRLEAIPQAGECRRLPAAIARHGRRLGFGG